ncbi:thioredoxin family protein [Priestia koreensis]|uniref:Thiol-disulfide isomerase n=1 Tax=Priestia koreensis TaxID=284581 RepID=A0A0M0L5L6_9BACI|nr:thioredoxin family protein [Priestia koreensis]KOO46366.1 thiol-disulfide isomerase [Priestia koreensis]MCM3006424.1 thioredoxin family protein [Priestia koreensis]UNL83674.1 thioredoxin family protein [Priestia koreensis]
MKQITAESEFREQIQKDELSVGIFTTTWCPDCKRLDMFIDEVLEENKDKAWFKVDKDEFEALSEENQVMGIPSLLVYRNGEKLAHLHSANAKTPEAIKEFLNTVK